MSGRRITFPVVIMLCLVLGLHWTFLRSVAWVNMFVTFAQRDTVHEALTKTFDGKHPCSVCKFVKHAKQGEKKDQLIKGELPLTLMLTLETPVLNPPASFSLLPLLDAATFGRFDSPLVPPPRTA